MPNTEHPGAARSTRTEPKTFTASEALVITRFFVRLTEQIELAKRENRMPDCLAMCRVFGQLRVRIFEVNDDGWFNYEHTILDEPRELEAA